MFCGGLAADAGSGSGRVRWEPFKTDYISYVHNELAQLTVVPQPFAQRLYCLYCGDLNRIKGGSSTDHVPSLTCKDIHEDIVCAISKQTCWLIHIQTLKDILNSSYAQDTRANVPHKNTKIRHLSTKYKHTDTGAYTCTPKCNACSLSMHN